MADTKETVFEITIGTLGEGFNFVSQRAQDSLLHLPTASPFLTLIRFNKNSALFFNYEGWM